MTSLSQRIAELRLVPVVAVDRADQAVRLAETLCRHDLPIIEVTLRTAAAVTAITRIRQALPDMLVGAGTVLNAVQMQTAADAGAQFAVAPGTNPLTLAQARALKVPFIPGVNNPTAIEMALNEGCGLLKFFPAEASGGVEMLKALLAPYQQLQIIPTGGINAANVHDYLAIPQVLACGGSWMVPPELLADDNWPEIDRLVHAAVQLAGTTGS